HRARKLRGSRLGVGNGRRRGGRPWRWRLGSVDRRVSESAPHPLEGAGVRIQHDHSAIPVAVSDERLVRLAIDDHVGGLFEVLRVLVSAALIAAAELLEKL